jgi:hypothetical protein
VSHTLASTEGLLPSEVRDRVIAAMGGDWNLSRHSWDDFPGAPDSRHLEHLAFAVAITDTDTMDGDRQRRNIGVMVSSTLSVRFGYRLRADSVSDDYSAALDAEADMVVSLRDVASDPELDVTIDRITRSAPDLFFVGEITCAILHRYPLS